MSCPERYFFHAIFDKHVQRQSGQVVDHEGGHRASMGSMKHNPDWGTYEEDINRGAYECPKDLVAGSESSAWVDAIGVDG